MSTDVPTSEPLTTSITPWLSVHRGAEAVDYYTVRMILTVEDPDSVFERALAAGATAVAPIYEEHGWRIGRVADPFGHHWEIGKPLSRDSVP